LSDSTVTTCLGGSRRPQASHRTPALLGRETDETLYQSRQVPLFSSNIPNDLTGNHRSRWHSPLLPSNRDSRCSPVNTQPPTALLHKNPPAQPPRRQARRGRSLGVRLCGSRASRPREPAIPRQGSLIHVPTKTIHNRFRKIGFVPAKILVLRFDPLPSPQPAERLQEPETLRQPAPIRHATQTIQIHLRILSFVPPRTRTPGSKARQRPLHLHPQPFAQFQRLISDTKNLEVFVCAR
jgi:hypothetical protein